MGALEHARPFLAPLYSWGAAVGNKGRKNLPWALLFIFRVLLREFTEERRAVIVKPILQDIGLAFRADAKAEGQDVAIGGWECIGGRGAEAARWFSVRLTRKNAPWAYSRGEPYRTIAALELYATLMCVAVFGDAWRGAQVGRMAVSGVTDNQGNSFVLSRLMCSKFPLLVVLAELSEQLRDRDLEMGLFWVPRDQNEEADALSNSDFESFSPDLRIEVDPAEICWKILPQMLEASEEIHREVQELRKEPGGKKIAKQRPEEKLRERERPVVSAAGSMGAARRELSRRRPMSRKAW